MNLIVLDGLFFCGYSEESLDLRLVGGVSADPEERAAHDHRPKRVSLPRVGVHAAQKNVKHPFFSYCGEFT
jgi:hypothetical protein